MPELPEVETARRTLEPLIVGRRIRRLEVIRPQALRSHSAAQASRLLNKQTISGVSRKGKALVFSVDNGWSLVFRFSLWGVVQVKDTPATDDMTAVALHLDNGQVMEFRELQLSNLSLFPQAEIDRVPYLAGLGLDPLDRRLTLARFRERLAGRGALRNLLTDQARLAGIGNLWALEILFAAGLRPSRTAETLSAAEWNRLYRASRSVLRRGIRAGGEPEFIDALGRKGRFRLAVYGRGGQPCRVCGSKIATGRVGGRPAFWCPRCQQ